MLDKGEPSTDLYGSWMDAPMCLRWSKNSRMVLGSRGGGSTINHPPSPPRAATSDEPPRGGSQLAPLEHNHLADTGGVNGSANHGIDVEGVITSVSSPKLSLMDSDQCNIRCQRYRDRVTIYSSHAEDPLSSAQNLPNKGLEGFSRSNGGGEYVHGIMEDHPNQPITKGQPNMYERD